VKIDGFHVDTLRMNRSARATLATVLLLALMATVAPAAAARPAADTGPVPPRTDVDPAARAATLRATVAQRTRAVRAAEARRDDWQRRLDETLMLEEAAQARTDHLSNVAAQAAARYAKSRTRLAKFAAEAYKDGPSVTPLTQLLSSKSAADYAYRHEIVSRVGDQQRDILARAKHDRVAAKVAADEARDQRNRLHELVQTLQQDLPARQEAVMSATATRDQAQFWLARWEAISGGTTTTILGPTLLSAEELATWFNANRRRPHTTVPIEELTRFYVEESVGTRVRADIAFAQSLLETGSFSFPAGGQVRGTDNNFAGMGACDSCNGGLRFPDARTGVRAQLQQLRVYADATLTNAALDPPAVNPKLDRHHLKGDVTTWGGLTGTWATAKTYGDRILTIYAQILAWLTDRADF
jgi:hypothetical protein